ncbi:hypothetical protein [Leisingera sp. ANG-DT]|uniref:hypothetical protein n=1 Tax=Leisingera sp. ANG-DT TaxID=1577897 RepID=UPI00057C7D8A|nr:hypothetical protein [Leisingera sp. ANG-DT]KIC15701.1 hypothetical protein RA21_15900 [Leisingera sp. ANG-DT]
MKAYLHAHLLLSPFLIFTILAPLGFPLLGAILGATIGLATSALRYGATIPPAFMTAQILGVVGVLGALLVMPSLKETNALAIVFSFLAGGALVSVVQNKPWTAELSAGDVGDFAAHPAFIKSNIMFSVMWMMIFAWFALANWQVLSPIHRWVPMILGGVITVIGPKFLMNIGRKRGIVPPPD